MNLLTSPTAVLLGLSLVAIVGLQISGDIRQIVQHTRSRKLKKRPSKLKSVRYLTDDSWQAAFRASHYALLRYKSRAIDGAAPKLSKAYRLRISWLLVVSAVSIVLTVLWLEGLPAGCILIFLYLGLMSILGLLAWPSNALEDDSQKLAIALLAPFSVFFRYN